VNGWLQTASPAVPGRARGAHHPAKEASMKISARNVIAGTLVEVKKGQTTAHVRIDIGGQVLTASITNEAVDELKLAAGQRAHAVIKASDVMIAVD
jgi:molybdopterin-binding protein